MSDKLIAPYGEWSSPITAEMVASIFVPLKLPAVKYDGGDLYWIEPRPADGRQVIMRRTTDGTIEDVLMPPYSARNREYELGGGEMAVANGKLVFTNFADERLYLIDSGDEPRPLTARLHEGQQVKSVRYADLDLHPSGQLVYCVREAHVPGEEPVNLLVAVALDGSSCFGKVIAEGSDFYAAPRVSKDGSMLAWLEWNHPDMPWDKTTLWVARLAKDGRILNKYPVASGQESILQPQWGPDNFLYFLSDRGGYWNLFKQDCRVLEQPMVMAEPVHVIDMPNDFGKPPWELGTSTYAVLDSGHIACCFSDGGVWRLALISQAGEESKINVLPTEFNFFDGFTCAGTQVAFSADCPTQPAAVVEYDLESESLTVVHRQTDVTIPPEYISLPEPMRLDLPDGQGTVYGLCYSPTNPCYQAPQGDLPPLLVMCHGGPTLAARPGLTLAIQYYTSRGWRVLNVNYPGSTGYGRDYRKLLDGQWGVLDVAACNAVAEHLISLNMVHPHHVAIKGGSSGGFTVQATLCSGAGIYTAGSSHFGICDLDLLAKTTHKLESRYPQTLIGPYPSDLYRQRSPLSHIARFNCPLILFQGELDNIVPPEQSQIIFDALRERGIPVAYYKYANEGHGFRMAENVRDTLRREHTFFSLVFGLRTSPEDLEDVQIENWLFEYWNRPE